MLTPSQYLAAGTPRYRRRGRQRLSGETPAPVRASDTYYRSSKNSTAANLWRESPERALQCHAHPHASRAPLQSERRLLPLPAPNRRAACDRVSRPSASPGPGHLSAAPAGRARQSPRWCFRTAVRCTCYAAARLSGRADARVALVRDGPALALAIEPGRQRAVRGRTSHVRVRAPATAWVLRCCSLCYMANHRFPQAHVGWTHQQDINVLIAFAAYFASSGV
jgi:hypothetical protein